MPETASRRPETEGLSDLAAIRPLRKRGFRRLTLVFVHGYSSDSSAHEAVRAKLARRGYGHYAFDLPGHGTNLTESEAQLRVSRYVSLVSRFIAARNLKRVALVGHSMGGAVAVGVNAACPERVSCLILEAPLNREAFRLGGERWAQMVLGRDETGQKRPFFARVKKLWRMRAKVKPLFRDILSRDVHARTDWAYGQIGDKPTLALFGAKDQVIPPRASIAYLASVASDLRVQVFAGAGHSPHRDAPDAYCAHVLDFLRDAARKDRFRKKQKPGE